MCPWDHDIWIPNPTLAANRVHHAKSAGSSPIADRRRLRLKLFWITVNIYWTNRQLMIAWNKSNTNVKKTWTDRRGCYPGPPLRLRSRTSSTSPASEKFKGYYIALGYRTPTSARRWFSSWKAGAWRNDQIGGGFEYCTISFNSAGPVTRDGPAEILVSATSQSWRDMPKFLRNFRQFSAAGDEKKKY